MTFVGSSSYGVVVLPVGGSKVYGVKLVLQREPNTCKTWFITYSILPDKEHVDAAVRELFVESGLTLIVDDFTMLSNKQAQVPLP
jgi:hypothetical protein